MKTLRKVKNWEFVKDELMGTTTIINEKINFIRLWNTGSDAQEEIDNVQAMTDIEFIEYCIESIPTTFVVRIINQTNK